MKYAGLKKNVFLVGCGERIEIWDKKMWLEIIKRAEKDFKKLSKTFKSLGLKNVFRIFHKNS